MELDARVYAQRAYEEYCRRDVEMTEEMLRVIRPRQGGKTTRLVIESYKTGATIVCHNEKMREVIMRTAKDLGIEIPRPALFRDLRDYRYRGQRPQSEGYLIDEVELCLCEMLPNVKIVGYSFTPRD